MNQEEFKSKLDNREFWGENSKEMWKASKEWLEQANYNNDLCKWSFDSGLKLDYDGNILSINSRFYPPHERHVYLEGYIGVICVYIGRKKIHEHEIRVTTIDELKMQTEKYCNDIIKNITKAVKSTFNK